MLARIVAFIEHAGRRAGHPARARRPQGEHAAAPWEGRRPARPERRRLVADRRRRARSPFADGYQVPAALDERRHRRRRARRSRTRRGARIEAGARVIELHARARLPAARVPVAAQQPPRRSLRRLVREPHRASCVEVVEAVRAVWPEAHPLFVRISATDWVDGGWTIEDSVALARAAEAARRRSRSTARRAVSSPARASRSAPGYQVPFAERVRREAGIATGAVGLITSPEQAEQIVRLGQADCRAARARDAARSLLADPRGAGAGAGAVGPAAVSARVLIATIPDP